MEQPAHQYFDTCVAAYEAGYTDTGVYVLQLSIGMFRAYCDMANGGWMVIQKRLDGVQNFNLSMDEYSAGFGNLCREFYWGNENLRKLLGADKWNLRVNLLNFAGNSTYQDYTEFRVHHASHELEVKGEISGNAGDGFSMLDNEKFSTYDNDQDGERDKHFAELYQSGWWFKKEETPPSNLNGIYYRPMDFREPWHGIIWVNDDSLKESEMRIKPPLV